MSSKHDEATVYVEAELRIPRSLSDAICSFIIDNICSGLVLEEEEDSSYTIIRFYVPSYNHKQSCNLLSGYLDELTGDVMPEAPTINSCKVRNSEWEKLYRESVKPLRIVDDILVRPPWTEEAEDVLYDIVIEPKMAFGTGRHETTRSCLKVVHGHFKKGMSFLDLGCGSGILSILAARMGARYIRAVDNDSVAVGNCQENFDINKINTPHDILLGSIEECENKEPFDFVCANIIKVTLLEFLKSLRSLTHVGGTLVLSGLLDQDEVELSSRLVEEGLESFRIVRDNNWLTYIILKS